MPLSQQELGLRIRSARESCSLTQEQLGAAVELSRAAITQIEAGARSVSSLELDRIAYAVGRDIRAFFADDAGQRDAIAALFRSDPLLTGQAQLVQALQESVALGHEVTNLEQLLGIDRARFLAATYDMPAPRKIWDATQQGERIAQDERKRLDLGVAPIGDISDLLESQGVRTGAVNLPDNISGLTLTDSKIGVFVVVNAAHPPLRRRFSLAHEYAHVLIDRNHPGSLSRTENRTELLEVRANAFAAAFLLPADGVLQYVQTLGKGGGSRAQVAVFDETEVVQAEQRLAPGSQDIQFYDVVRLAHRFGASHRAMIHRLRNLRVIGESDHKSLIAQEASGRGLAVARFLRAGDPPRAAADDCDDFRGRFLGLALEAYRRDEITRSKLTELAAMVGVARAQVDDTLDSAGLA